MSTSNLKKYKFYVNGMHCGACEVLTETELKEQKEVTDAKASLSTMSIEVTGDFGNKPVESIASELSKALIPHGYSLSLMKGNNSANWSDFKIALPIALGFGILFVVLQKIGLVNLIGEEVGYGTAFVIGIVASVSSCMAVVGGLLLSMSATFAKHGDRVRPQILFHAGRLVSFFILGGVIGAIGSAFTLNTATTFILSLLIALVMLVLGINLLDVFPWAKRLQPSMPRFLSGHAMQVSKLNHSLTPLLMGIATFFLPCGFTQSMQLYTLQTGSFIDGGIFMLIFALGTLPVLALISFSSFSIQKSGKAGIFFKTAGLVVIMFAILNLLSSLTAIGLIPPVLNL